LIARGHSHKQAPIAIVQARAASFLLDTLKIAAQPSRSNERRPRSPPTQPCCCTPAQASTALAAAHPAAMAVPFSAPIDWANPAPLPGMEDMADVTIKHSGLDLPAHSLVLSMAGNSAVLRTCSARCGLPKQTGLQGSRARSASGATRWVGCVAAATVAAAAAAKQVTAWWHTQGLLQSCHH